MLFAREDLTRSFRDTNTRESSGQSMMFKDLYFYCLNYLHGSACRSGLTDESSLRFKLVMQKEILVQAVANMGPLCLPLMLQVQYSTGVLYSTVVCTGVRPRQHPGPHHPGAAGLGDLGRQPGLGAHCRQAEEGLHQGLSEEWAEGTGRLDKRKLFLA